MAIQTSFANTIGVAKAGHLADQRGCELISRVTEGAGGIVFGGAVVEGTDQGEARAITTGDTVVLGVAVRDRSVAAGLDKFAQYENATILTKGSIWLTVGATVTPGSLCYVVIASGVWTNVATAAIAIGVWETDATSGNLARASINLP